MLYSIGSYDLFEFLDGSQPQHPHGARLAIHAFGDLVERQALQITQHDHVAVLRAELGQLICQGHRPLSLPHGGTGRGPRIGEPCAS